MCTYPKQRRTTTRQQENMPETHNVDIFVGSTGRRDEVGDELPGVVADVEGVVGGLSRQHGTHNHKEL